MQENHYISLLQKDLVGEISETDKKALDIWLAASPENKNIAKSVGKVWELSGGFNGKPEVDLNTEYARLEASIKAENKTSKVVRLISRRRWIWAVASIAILLASAFLINQMEDEDSAIITEKTGSKATKEIQLDDGTIVWLNSNSELHYPSTFSGKERKINLSGEAYFKVVHLPEKPFIVTSENGIVEVLGTSFNVRDMPSEPTMTVHVIDGKVSFESEAGKMSVILEKNEAGILTKSSSDLKEIINDDFNDIAWHTKKLSFDNAPLNEVVDVIQTFYKIEVFVENQLLQDCTFTAEFNNKSADLVLETIGIVFEMEVETISDRSFRLKGGSC
ncbi:MAG: FecR domain-containing protein [Bacteroidota bacterium]